MVVGMRLAVNRRQCVGSGSRVMNPRTEKRPLAAGYAPATMNQALRWTGPGSASLPRRGFQTVLAAPVLPCPPRAV